MGRLVICEFCGCEEHPMVCSECGVESEFKYPWVCYRDDKGTKYFLCISCAGKHDDEEIPACAMKEEK